MSYIAAVIGLGGLGFSAYNIFGGGGGGGGNQGGIQYANPASSLLPSLLGLVPQTQTNNGVKTVTYQPGPNSIFGPQGASQIADFLRNPLALSSAELSAGDIMGQIPQSLANAQGIFNQQLIPFAQNMMQTGLPTSMQPVINAANYLFQNQQLPSIKEQFAGQIGSMGSDFFNAITRGLTSMDTQLGGLQTQLDEAARGRQLQGAGLLSEFGLANEQLPFTAAQDLLGLGGAFRQAQESTRPGSRLLQGLQTFTDLGSPSTTGPYMMGQFPSAGTQMLSGLSQSLPGLFSGFGGGNGSNPFNFTGTNLGNAFNSFFTPAGTGGSTPYNPNVNSSLFGGTPGVSPGGFNF